MVSNVTLGKSPRSPRLPPETPRLWSCVKMSMMRRRRRLWARPTLGARSARQGRSRRCRMPRLGLALVPSRSVGCTVYWSDPARAVQSGPAPAGSPARSTSLRSLLAAVASGPAAPSTCCRRRPGYQRAAGAAAAAWRPAGTVGSCGRRVQRPLLPEACCAPRPPRASLG